MAAAAIIFFAFYGFDAIATAAEEAKNPDRDLAIGIVGSMLLCVLIYMVVAAVAIGALSYTRFADSPGAAGADPARDRTRLGGQDPRRFGGDRAADRDPGLLLRPEPDLLRHGARRAAARPASPGCRSAGRRCGSPCSPRSWSRSSPALFPLADDRRARQCRDARGVHRGLRGDAGDAARASPTRRASSRTPLPWVVGIARHPRLRSICSSACR